MSEKTVVYLNEYYPEGLSRLESYLASESERSIRSDLADTRGQVIGSLTEYEFKDGMVVCDFKLGSLRFLNAQQSNQQNRTERLARLDRIAAGLEFPLVTKNDREDFGREDEN